MDGLDSRTPGLRMSPTGRIPQWVLDEAAGREPGPSEWRSWSPPPPRRRSRVRGVAVVLVVGLILGGAVLADPGLFGRGGVAEAGTGFPTAGREAADAPLGTPMAPPYGGGSHAFVARQDDDVEPVAYDPCRPIHYVMRPDNAPWGGEQILHDAVDRVSAVTGLRFVYDGATAELPSWDREPYQPDRYGDRWAPVVIAWETEQENPTFMTDIAGEAGSQSMSIADGPAVFVTGAVRLDEAAFDRILAAPDGDALARAIVLHELGHLVGLDHVSDPGQLMHPSAVDVLDFAPGDLTGLSALGRGPCVPEL